MNNPKIISLLFFFYLAPHSYGEYYPLKCNGPVPSCFHGKYFEMANLLFETNKDSLKYGHSNDAREYYHSNQYFLKNFILSGDVIYGDPISKSLQRQADEIAKKFDFQTLPQIFLLRSTEVNAYATQTGAIFFTTALISHLDNYYELVYILCHELSHVANEDLYDEFIERREIFFTPFDGKINKLINNYFRHSVECEFRADSEGYTYYTSMKYPQEMAITSLRHIDSSDLFPFFNYSFDSILSLEPALPGLTINKHDLKPFYSAVLDFDPSTHPEFLERYDTLEKQQLPDYDLQIALDESNFSDFKTIATNETLYTHYLDQEYFMIIAFYHLANFKFCDKQFVEFLYAKSLYAILKIRLFIENQKTKTYTKTNDVKYEGDLDNWLETLKPDGSFLGPERPFIFYFRKISLTNMWAIVSKAILDSHNESDYFYPAVIFEDCLQIYDSLTLDSLQSVDSKSHERIYEELEEAQEVEANVHKLSQTKERLVLIRPFWKIPKASTLDQSKINYEYFDQLIVDIFQELGEKYSENAEILTSLNLNETDKLNKFISLYFLFRERGDLSVVETFGSSSFDDEFLSYKKITYIRFFQTEMGLYLKTFDVNIENGKIENFRNISSNNSSTESKGKIRSLIKKYYKGINRK